MHLNQQTIKDLFEEPSGLDSLTKDDSNNCGAKEKQQSKSEMLSGSNETNLNDDMIEQVLLSDWCCMLLLILGQ